MRIPTNNFATGLVSQLQNLTGKQSALQTAIATGQRITNPSDDPAAIARVLRLQGEKREIQQFSRNHDRAMNVSQSSFSAIKQLKETSDRAGEIAVLGVGTSGVDALTANVVSASTPCPMRGAHAALSPSLGEPATLLAWQAWQIWL